MGTLVNGIKEIFATAKTTGSNVMLCGNDGTPDGHMTMANLASVLGASLFTSSEQKVQDLNDLQYGCFYSGDMNKVQNSPSVILSSSATQACVLCVKNNWFGRGFQFAISKIGIASRFQNNSSPDVWTDWKRLDEGVIPSFYKNYSDLSSLANALGVFTSSYATNIIGQETDMNNLRSNHIYVVNTQEDSPHAKTGYPSNLPVNGDCIILVIAPTDADVLQIVMYNSLFYARVRFANQGWKDWKQLTITT